MHADTMAIPVAKMIMSFVEFRMKTRETMDLKFGAANSAMKCKNGIFSLSYASF